MIYLLVPLMQDLGLYVLIQTVYLYIKAVENLALSCCDEEASVIIPVRPVIHHDLILWHHGG